MLFVWENQDLSGHERKRRFQGFKVAAVSQWRGGRIEKLKDSSPSESCLLNLRLNQQVGGAGTLFPSFSLVAYLCTAPRRLCSTDWCCIRSVKSLFLLENL